MPLLDNQAKNLFFHAFLLQYSYKYIIHILLTHKVAEVANRNFCIAARNNKNNFKSSSKIQDKTSENDMKYERKDKKHYTEREKQLYAEDWTVF